MWNLTADCTCGASGGDRGRYLRFFPRARCWARVVLARGGDGHSLLHRDGFVQFSENTYGSLKHQCKEQPEVGACQIEVFWQALGTSQTNLWLRTTYEEKSKFIN